MSNPEQRKYEELWKKHPEYRVVAPGEQLADHFLSLAQPLPHDFCYDFGCGTGRGAARISARCRVVGLDFVDGCIDEGVRGKFEFAQHDLTQPVPGPVADYGYCTDVMEHVPPEQVPTVLFNIVRSAKKVYFCISTVDDKMGALIGEPLHLTVKPMAWWKEQLEAFGFTVAFEQDLGAACVFYGSAWMSMGEVAHTVKLNVQEDQVYQNIQENLALGLQEVAPHDAQDTEIMLLCGGPSLADFRDEIIGKNRAGTPVVTVNGAYNWLIENGGRPGAQVLVDAREFNRRFTEPTVLQCKYLVSSQCDTSLVKSLPRSQTYLWHCAGDQVKTAVEDYSKQHERNHAWYPVPGGTTVTLRAIPLLGMLGYRKIHVYGFDSCLRGDEHHAYKQAENDTPDVVEMTVAGKVFKCQPWMAKQAYEFKDVVKHLLAPAGIELAVHGDGLIATILEAASAATME